MMWKSVLRSKLSQGDWTPLIFSSGLWLKLIQKVIWQTKYGRTVFSQQEDDRNSLCDSLCGYCWCQCLWIHFLLRNRKEKEREGGRGAVTVVKWQEALKVREIGRCTHNYYESQQVNITYRWSEDDLLIKSNTNTSFLKKHYFGTLLHNDTLTLTIPS